jgi:hypothetical protein
MQFDKPKGKRLHRYFYGITSNDGLWWIPSIKQWVDYYPHAQDCATASTYYPCRTLKAFRRHLRKHPEIRGKAVFKSLYQGFDVYA